MADIPAIRKPKTYSEFAQGINPYGGADLAASQANLGDAAQRAQANTLSAAMGQGGYNPSMVDRMGYASERAAETAAADRMIRGNALKRAMYGGYTGQIDYGDRFAEQAALVKQAYEQGLQGIYGNLIGQGVGYGVGRLQGRRK